MEVKVPVFGDTAWWPPWRFSSLSSSFPQPLLWLVHLRAYQWKFFLRKLTRKPATSQIPQAPPSLAFTPSSTIHPARFFKIVVVVDTTHQIMQSLFLFKKWFPSTFLIHSVRQGCLQEAEHCAMRPKHQRKTNNWGHHHCGQSSSLLQCIHCNEPFNQNQGKDLQLSTRCAMQEAGMSVAVTYQPRKDKTGIKKTVVSDCEY